MPSMMLWLSETSGRLRAMGGNVIALRVQMTTMKLIPLIREESRPRCPASR